MAFHKAPSVTYLGPADKHSGTANKPITRIVMHGTVSPTARGGARKTAAYFRSNSAGGSAHYVVDPGEVVQVAYDSVVAWHAPPNPHSIGVELCDWVGKNGKALPLARWADDEHASMLRLAARLVAELCLAYAIPPNMVDAKVLKTGRGGICEHSDVSEAFKQSSHWDLGEFPRSRFQRMVRNEVRYIKSGQSKTGGPITATTICPANRGKGKLPIWTEKWQQAQRAKAQKAIRANDIAKHPKAG